MLTCPTANSHESIVGSQSEFFFYLFIPSRNFFDLFISTRSLNIQYFLNGSRDCIEKKSKKYIITMKIIVKICKLNREM